MASPEFVPSFSAQPVSPMVATADAGEAAGSRRAATEEQLAALRLEFAEVYRELYEGAQMQRMLSGPRLLRRGPFEVAAEIFPVRHLSGDFFSVSDLGTTALLAIGDIAGKGLLAGMWFTYLLGLTRIYGVPAKDAAAALAAINRVMCETTGSPERADSARSVVGSAPPLTSLFLARLDWVTGELQYCNAGHPAPLLLRAGGKAEFLSEGGPGLGAAAEARFDSARVVLEPGDTLVGYSDGLLECREENGEEFGVERVLDEVLKSASAPATEMLFSIIGAARDFAGAYAREDDCTLMVVQHKGQSAA